MNLDYDPGTLKRRARTRKLIKFGIPIVVLLAIGCFTWFMWLKPNGGIKDQYGLPTSNVTYEWAHARPEGQLYYPGAEELHKFGSSMGVDGAVGATSGAILSVNASPDQLYVWYKGWLLAHGWSCGDVGEGGLGTWITHMDCKKIENDRELFTVAMDHADVLAKTQGVHSPAGTTVFEISYMVY